MLRIWLAFIAVITLAGCELLQPRPSGTVSSGPNPPAQTEASTAEIPKPQVTIVEASDSKLREHLQFIDRLNKSDDQQIKQIHAQSKAAFEEKPDADNRLQLAWVRATPGHAHTNLWAARQQLRQSLNRGELSDELARLVRIRLNDIERNLHMANKLSEADAKLRALTTLEHSMEERDAEVQEE